MLEIKLTVKRLEYRAPKSANCLAIYNVVFEGKTVDGKEPTMRGVRVFPSETEGKRYVRLPQRFNRGLRRYLDTVQFPAEEFRALEKLVVDHLQKTEETLEQNRLEEVVKEVFK